MNSWLKKIKEGAGEMRPSSMVITGPSGVGKTSMGGNIPDAVAMPFTQENSFDLLKKSGAVPEDLAILPPPETWDQALEMFEELATGKHSYKCLIIDTLSCLENLCHTSVCNREFHGDWGDRGFQAYHRGYEIALADWREMLNALDRLRDEKGMSVVMLEHVHVKPFKNPEGSDYDRYQPTCHPKTWQVTQRWVDAVLFFNYYVEVDDSGNRAKGRGGHSRVLYTQYSAAFDAKNRFGCDPEIEAGTSGKEAWENLRSNIAGGLLAAKEEA